MDKKIVIPGSHRPDNLYLSDDVKTAVVESDVYDICHRIAELSPNLYIINAHSSSKHVWIIMEHCKDGVDRPIFRTNELDARVLTKLREMLSYPLAKRIEILEKEAERIAEKQKEEAADELYERMGAPMWKQLEKDGFIQRPVSYPKRFKRLAK
jgi:hypothetical protein